MADGARLDVHLHPLVLINMSDHVVRARSSDTGKERVLGALIGAQEGRRIDLHNSFELLVEGEGDTRALDLEFFQQRLAQYLEVFPRYEFLGWYSTGKTPHEGDKALHKKIQEVTANENPFALLLDTEAMDRDKSNQSEELPVKVYDSVTHITGGDSSTTWTEVPYVIDTLEAERISVNHVAKSATTATSGHSSDFTQHTSGLSNSVAMVSKRLKELLEYMQEVKAGRAQKNHEVLRQMLSICQALKASHPEALQKQFSDEFNDAHLVVMLSSLTKTCAHTSDLLDKFQLAHDKKHRQRHHYPFG
jgi:COP9 signalosome complex subunit 6